MGQIYNVYCDESCHLENDHQKAMVLGSVWCPLEKASEIMKRIREIKKQYGLNERCEIKWTKISPSKVDFYQQLVDYFFDDDDLHFRCLVVPDKSILNHENYNQTHDQWYYKMYFDLLKTIFIPGDRYRIYIDIKDTLGGNKKEKLHKVLCNNMYDFDRKTVERLQIIRSHEVEIMQLTDLLSGAVSHINREINKSDAKNQIISRIKDRSGYSLKKSTLYRENKFNIFIWKAKVC
ncbi:MAG TPA: DUF3800 domain-containing protein [Candidatus Moranbacteria bacterium]|nr:MAG: hypothetical protein UR51_C0004G0026 [Candidatus Moranbacteria bacterium GW2011_GWF1_34_10]HBI16588.1 DUF3800 domain-containing protein [Candidatus Moranbacteria bacterium]